MKSRSSENFAAATINNPGSRASEDGQQMTTSVALSSSTALKREEEKAFEVKSSMATSTPTSSSVSVATHKKLNSEENPLNSVNPVSNSLFYMIACLSIYICIFCCHGSFDKVQRCMVLLIC